LLDRWISFVGSICSLGLLFVSNKLINFVLVNSAGIGVLDLVLEDIELSAWNRMIDINLLGSEEIVVGAGKKS
jgi:NAD(P)-dependent dehydrogenase (short-subunit alcohol dehydrogenase family)